MGWNDRLLEEYEYKCGVCGEFIVAPYYKQDGETCDECQERILNEERAELEGWEHEKHE